MNHMAQEENEIHGVAREISALARELAPETERGGGFPTSSCPRCASPA